MLKFYSLLASLFLLARVVAAQEISVTQKLPDAIFPDKNFTVEVTVNKGMLNGFLRYYVDLPRGYVPSPIDIKNGSFKMVDTSIRIVWLVPPSESRFSFSFKVVPPHNAKGNLIVGGKISYLVDTIKKSINIPKKTIKIVSSYAAQMMENNAAPGGTTATSKTNNASVVKESQKATPSAKSNSGIIGKIYRIQVGVFKTRPNLKDIPELTFVEFPGGITKYYSGNFTSQEEAIQHKNWLIAKGYKGVFIVAFENGKVVK